MTLEVLTPDKLIFKGEAQSVVFPGIDGQFGVLSHHTALISALKQGKIVVKKEKGGEIEGSLKKEVVDQSEFNIEVNGGTVEVNNNKILVLAE